MFWPLHVNAPAGLEWMNQKANASDDLISVMRFIVPVSQSNNFDVSHQCHTPWTVSKISVVYYIFIFIS